MYQLINLIFSAFELLILARVLLTWVTADRYNPIVQFIYNTTEPILAPVRRALPQTGMMDFSPMVVIIAAWVLQRIVLQILF